MGHASEIPDEPLKNGDTMGSLLVYKCSHCGASKATNKLHFMLLCDYCGGLVGFDDFGFARSDHYQNLLSKMQTDVASPGTTAYRLRQLFYCEMEEARQQHQRQIWHDKAEEYYRLYYNYYYESFLREYVDDPRYQLENMVRTSLLWYEVSYFDERMTQSWGEYEKAWNEFEKRPDENSLRQAERLISLYTSVLEKLFEIITPAKLDVNCQAHELVRGTLSRWFHQIVTDTGLPPAMRQAIAELYEKMSPGLCNQKEKNVAVERERVNLDCESCGRHFAFEDKDGVYSCPQCNTSYRYLKNQGVVSR